MYEWNSCITVKTCRAVFHSPHASGTASACDVGMKNMRPRASATPRVRIGFIALGMDLALRAASRRLVAWQDRIGA